MVTYHVYHVTVVCCGDVVHVYHVTCVVTYHVYHVTVVCCGDVVHVYHVTCVLYHVTVVCSKAYRSQAADCKLGIVCALSRQTSVQDSSVCDREQGEGSGRGRGWW